MREPTEIRLLTAAARPTRPYPRMAVFVLGGAFLLAVVAARHTMAVSMVTKILAAFCGASLGHWLETRIHGALIGRHSLLRLLGAGVMPWLGLLAVGVVGVTVGPVGIGLGDRGTLMVAAVCGGLWIFSSAFGTLVVVAIDILISAAVPDFRSRVQLAVFGLIFMVTVLASGVVVASDRLAEVLKVLLPTLNASIADGTIDLGQAPVSVEGLN